MLMIQKRNYYNLLEFLGISFIFFLFSFALHHNAFGSFWHFDDGAHLLFALNYTPDQYFFDPDIARLQSYANITPWNAFFYDVNIGLFGLNPRYFYIIQFSLVVASAIATFYLLKLWHSTFLALTACLVFLTGLPVTHIVLQIMTGHYITGLFFTILSLLFFAYSIRENKNSYLLVSIIFYILSIYCKEVYVPMIAVLYVLPIGTYAKRIKASIPFIIIFLLYLLWRYIVLGALFSGYYLGNEIAIMDRISQFINIPLLLFHIKDINSLSFILFIIIFLGIFTSFVKSKINIYLLITSFVILLIPLIPLTKFPGLHSPDRYFLLIWWAASILISQSLFSLNKKGIIVIPAILILILNQQQELQSEEQAYVKYEKLYKYAVNPIDRSVLYSDSDKDYLYTVLSNFNEAYRRYYKIESNKVVVLQDGRELCESFRTGKTILMYDDENKKLKDITLEVPNILNQINEKNSQVIIGKKLGIYLSRDDRYLYWKFVGDKGAKFVIMVNGDKLPIPVSGRIPKYEDTLNLKIQLQMISSEGWTAVSPIFKINIKRYQAFHWEGNSIDNKIKCNMENLVN